MKRLIVFAVCLASTFIIAQGINYPNHDWRRYTTPYDPKTLPPLTVSEAYSLSLKHLGTATNRFQCIGAGCLKLTRSGYPGWTFCFLDSNGEPAYLDVTFDKEVYTDSRTEARFQSK